MKTSSRGIAEIASHEAVVLSRYLDSVGVWTIGIGHTANAGGLNPEGFKGKLTLEQALEMFAVDLAKFEKRVNEAFTRPLTQSEFDAAVSFDFNTGAIKKATWVKTFNAGNKPLAVQQIMSWAKPKEIIPRRKKEQLLFANGTYSGGPIMVYDASPNGKVLWNSGKSIALPNQPPAPTPLPAPPVAAPIKREPPELDYVPEPAKPKSQIAWGRILGLFFLAAIAVVILKGL